MRDVHRLLLAAVLSALVAGEACANSAMTVWTRSVNDKVQPTTEPTASDAIVMEGGKASVEAYQIVVTASPDGLAGVDMTASDLSDGAGHTISRAGITFFREAFIDFTGVKAKTGAKPVPENSPSRDGRIPDPLIPFVDPYAAKTTPVGAPFAVAPKLNQPVWMDVVIPATAVAGTYAGKVTVAAAGQPSVVIPVTLTVWNLTLPDMRAVRTHFKMSSDNVILYHRNTYACPDSGACWLDGTSSEARTVVKRYEEMAHEHRIDTGEAFLPNRGTDCSVPTASDWATWDQTIAPYMDGSYWRDHIPSGRIATPFSPGSENNGDALEGCSCTPAQYAALAQAYASHLKAKGWFSAAIVFAADEPNADQYPDMAADSKALQAADKDWKPRILDTTEPRPSNVAMLAPALGIFAVDLAGYGDWWDPGADHPYGRAEWPSLFKQGVELWFYESNAQAAPYPTYATNTLLGMEPQMMKWGSWYEGATGFLMWDTTAWDKDHPWGPNTTMGKTGDGVLIYPGAHDGLNAQAGSPKDVAIDGPVASYRLKMIREGLQDWALFDLAKQKGVGVYARTQVERAYGQFGGCNWKGCPSFNGKFYWLTDAALLASIRHNIATAIEAANSAPGASASPRRRAIAPARSRRSRNPPRRSGRGGPARG